MIATVKIKHRIYLIFSAVFSSFGRKYMSFALARKCFFINFPLKYTVCYDVILM